INQKDKLNQDAESGRMVGSENHSPQQPSQAQQAHTASTGARGLRNMMFRVTDSYTLDCASSYQSIVLSSKVGVTRYCMGGALAIASSVLEPKIDVAVAFYGVPPIEFADAAKIKLPVQAHFGERDNVV
ncbi:dienelactone hydrolase, partial [Tanacetum coccineum]